MCLLHVVCLNDWGTESVINSFSLRHQTRQRCRSIWLINHQAKRDKLHHAFFFAVSIPAPMGSMEAHHQALHIDAFPFSKRDVDLKTLPLISHVSAKGKYQAFRVVPLRAQLLPGI